MEPKIIDQNFFNQEELDDIKTKVFMLKDHWKGINDSLETDKLLISRVLPSGAYTKYFSKQEIEANNEMMFKHFSYYYDKIKNKLSSFFNIPINYSHSLQYPGFHIFLNNNGTNEVTRPLSNFHLDVFPKLRFRLAPGEIQSVTIPITLPSNGSYLLFNNSGDRSIHNLNRSVSRLKSDKVFEYTTGMMAIWPGNLPHSIGPFTLENSSESRITMQMHINIESDKGTIFW